MPAYNAAKTLISCYDALPKEWIDDVILVDDASSDNTLEVARQLPIFVLAHDRNQGYGGNQKICYKAAMERGQTLWLWFTPTISMIRNSSPA